VRKPINLDIKQEIISKQKIGKNVGDVSAKYNMAKSKIRTILKNKEEIKSAQIAKGICRLRCCMVILL
jgi:Mor family transcriptional regulator